MRLLCRETAQVQSYHGSDQPYKPVTLRDFDDEVPPYAILSHTWGRSEEEVTYQDLQAGRYGQHGFAKIEFTLDRAARQGIQYAWVDTCCINKYNSTELGKAINLMYEWYTKSSVCYVYLSDVPRVRLEQSRWFTRGWTLQELLAPSKVEFYDSLGCFLGTRDTLARSIQAVTGLPLQALRGDVHNVPIVDRFRWSTGRQTKEPEDASYCMVGLLGIKMLFGYGLGALDCQERLFEAVAKKYGAVIAEQLRENSRVVNDSATRVAYKYVPDQLRQALQFDNAASRRDAIKHPLYATCTWLLHHPTYQRWLDKQFDFLWIKGHPGTGKSTLVKYADLETQLEARMVQISFYFNARGVHLEKSTTGMYRALLAQIFEQLPNAEEYVQRQLRIRLSPVPDWSLGQLKDIFRLSIRRLGDWRIRCFVDALDECADEDIQDTINFFRDIARESPQRLMVCMASRYYPAVTCRDSVELRLDQQQQHTNDVRKYVLDRLDLDDAEIVDEVCKKADGVFMWAVLAVGLLNEQLINGFAHNAHSIITELPRGLDGIYQEIISAKHTDVERFRLCIQFILFSYRPMTGQVLHDAICYGLGQNTQYGGAPSRATLERFVTSSSRGLAKLVAGSDETVQFVHESVRDFLLRHNGLRALFPQVHEELTAWSHDCLKTICANCIAFNPYRPYFTGPPAPWMQHRQLDLKQMCPFLLYSMSAVIYHAEQAALGVSQVNFVSTMDWQTLIAMHVRQKLSSARMLSENMSAAHLIACHDAVRLMSIAAWSSFDLHCLSDNIPPIVVALKSRALNIVRQLLIYGVGTNWRTPAILLAMEEVNSEATYFEERLIWLPQNARLLDSSCAAFSDQQALLLAWTGNDASVVRLLLAYGADVNQRSVDGSTPLMMACEEDWPDMVELLLAYKASIDLTDQYGDTALMTAAGVASDSGVVKLLLAHKADVNMKNRQGTTALMRACLEADLESVRLLLEHDAFVEDADQDGFTALMLACQGDPELVQLLLEYGAKPDSASKNGETSLHHASRCDPHAVKLLLEHQAKVNTADQNGRTPLMTACENGFPESVLMLLERSASVDLIDKTGATALMAACVTEDPDLVKSLLEYGASLDLANFEDVTALMIACGESEVSVVKRLLEAGASIDLLDCMGRTALFYACDQTNYEIVSVLVEHGSNVNICDRLGMHLLHWTIESRPGESEGCNIKEDCDHIAILTLLLDHKADTGAVNLRGETPRTVALNRGDGCGQRMAALFPTPLPL